MSEEHWLIKPGIVIKLLGSNHSYLENRALYLAHVVTPGGLKLYLRPFIEELATFIKSGSSEAEPYISFAQTDEARRLGEQGFNQLLLLIQQATQENRITGHALAEILGINWQVVLRWNMPRADPIHIPGIRRPHIAYSTGVILQNLEWRGPGVTM